MPGNWSRSTKATPVWFADDDGVAYPMPSAAATDTSGAPKAPLYTPLGYRQVTSTGTAFTLAAVPAGTRRVIIQAEAQALRWRDDGTAPTATVGMTITSGGELRYDGTMGAIQLIAATAGAIANISFYG